MLQFNLGDEVVLYNPRSTRQKVAMGTISKIGGEGKFYFLIILETWLKMDVHDILAANTALMFFNEDN